MSRQNTITDFTDAISVEDDGVKADVSCLRAVIILNAINQDKINDDQLGRLPRFLFGDRGGFNEQFMDLKFSTVDTEEIAAQMEERVYEMYTGIIQPTETNSKINN